MLRIFTSVAIAGDRMGGASFLRRHLSEILKMGHSDLPLRRLLLLDNVIQVRIQLMSLALPEQLLLPLQVLSHLRLDHDSGLGAILGLLHVL